MELPTYTNIWKIEKRLYKLYDFRLPMPLPIGQVTAFLAIAVPYMLILTLAGMPFSHTWVWLYVLPPGVLAWLVTRPVLEGKRLPELVLSQVRYLAEPRTWCRMAPAAEKDLIVVVARVWRAPVAAAETGPAAGLTQAGSIVGEAEAGPAAVDATAACLPQEDSAHPAPPAWPDRPAVSSRVRARAVDAALLGRVRAAGSAGPASLPAARPTPDAGVPDGAEVGDAAEAVDAADAAGVGSTAHSSAAWPGVAAPAAGGMADESPASPTGPAVAPTTPPTAARKPAARKSAATGATTPPSGRPTVTVRADGAAHWPLHVVERALRTAPGGTGTSWRDRVVVVPGGHRPGKPDHVQRDQARARLALPGPARIVVLGTTSGAGQTVTALLTGQLMASLRGEAVAVLDLSAGPGSLTERAREIPRLLPGRHALPGSDVAPPSGSGRERALQVVTAEHTGPGPRDADRLIDAVCARYPLTIADPSAGDVPRALRVADQLVLVSPAGPDAPGSLAMTLEWLEAHGHTRLLEAAVTLVNGVSEETAGHAERAAGVAAGRCRAVVRVPWDARLANGRALAVATVQAYTALIGVLISGLAQPRQVGAASADAPPAGPAPAGQR